MVRSTMIWRDPPEESIDLYPGLVVHDGRVSGSITFGRSRLPVWAIFPQVIYDGWARAEGDFPQIRTEYGWDRLRASELMSHLMEMRGEFARLLCVLADADRQE